MSFEKWFEKNWGKLAEEKTVEQFRYEKKDLEAAFKAGKAEAEETK